MTECQRTRSLSNTFPAPLRPQLSLISHLPPFNARPPSTRLATRLLLTAEFSLSPRSPLDTHTKPTHASARLTRLARILNSYNNTNNTHNTLHPRFGHAITVPRLSIPCAAHTHSITHRPFHYQPHHFFFSFFFSNPLSLGSGLWPQMSVQWPFNLVSLARSQSSALSTYCVSLK